MQSLILRAGRDIACNDEMREIGADFLHAHVFGLAPVVKENEAFDPIAVGLFSAIAHAAQTDDGAHLIHELWL